MNALTDQMSNLGMASSAYTQSMQYPDAVAGAYAQPSQYNYAPQLGRVNSDPEYTSAYGTSPYAVQPRYAQPYPTGHQGYAQQSSAYGYDAQHYATYPAEAVAYATVGGATSSATYTTNSSNIVVNTTRGRVNTEHTTLVITKLSPKTTQKDVESVLSEVRASDGSNPQPLKIELKNWKPKADEKPKSQITAIVTYNSYADVSLAHAYVNGRTINKRAVTARIGKESKATTSSVFNQGPLVVSSTW